MPEWNFPEKLTTAPIEPVGLNLAGSWTEKNQQTCLVVRSNRSRPRLTSASHQTLSVIVMSYQHCFSDSHQPCLLASLETYSPFQGEPQQSSKIVPGKWDTDAMKFAREASSSSRSLEVLDEGKMASLIVTFILKPAFALVSINITFSSRAFVSPSSIETCLRGH